MAAFLKKIKLRTIHQKILMALMISILVAGAAKSGALYMLDTTVGDMLYQKKDSAFSGEVVLIAIDEKSLNTYGSWPWSRDVMAMAIETLNIDEEMRPAAIGIDVLYIDSGVPADDSYLVEAASLADNVVFASYGQYANQIVGLEDDGIGYMDRFYVAEFYEPFDELRAVSNVGAINAMFDLDGRLRHAPWYIEVRRGERIVPSFARELARLYAEYHGLEVNVPPMDTDGRYFVKFTGSPGEMYDAVGVADLINGEVEPEWYAGKVVLIGPYDASLKDAFMTAVDYGVEMNGVEFQGNIVEMLIKGDFKEEFAVWPQLLFLLVLVFLCAMWLWERKVFPATIVSFLLVVGWILFCILIYEQSHVFYPLWIPIGVVSTYVASVATNYIRARLEKLRVTNTFKKYVAPEIVAEILKEGSEALGLGGKTTEIAVLFVDIRGFTPMSEALSAEEVVGILNRYLSLTSHCILENKGTLDKFIGDATMAFWGAPLPQEDHVYKAVKTGMDMIAMSMEMGEELLARYGRTVSFGIGVHCGPAVVGNIGAVNRMDYTAIGDTVNTAARLESNAPHNKLLISRAVADALEGRIECVSLGDSIKLKGKSDGFEILQVEKLL